MLHIRLFSGSILVQKNKQVYVFITCTKLTCLVSHQKQSLLYKNSLGFVFVWQRCEDAHAESQFCKQDSAMSLLTRLLRLKFQQKLTASAERPATQISQFGLFSEKFLILASGENWRQQKRHIKTTNVEIPQSLINSPQFRFYFERKVIVKNYTLISSYKSKYVSISNFQNNSIRSKA